MVAKRKTAEGAKSESSESPASEHKRKRVIPVAAVEQLAAAAVPAAKDDIVMPVDTSADPKSASKRGRKGDGIKDPSSLTTAKKANDDIVNAAFMPLDTSADKKRTKRGRKRDAIPFSTFTGTEKSAVIYVGRIPHGFYEQQMRGFFSQFGDIKRLRLSRNKKTGRSKHYAFIEFESPEVAPIVAEAMHNYLLCESMLQVKVVPLEKIKPKMWVGANKRFKRNNWQKLERDRQNRVRTPKDHSRHLGLLVLKDNKRRKKLQDLGIDYDYPALKDLIPKTSKKIMFSNNED